MAAPRNSGARLVPGFSGDRTVRPSKAESPRCRSPSVRDQRGVKTNEPARDFGREGVQLAFRLRLRLGGGSDVVSAFGAATDALMLAMRLDFTDLEQAATTADTLSTLLRAANTSFLKSAHEPHWQEWPRPDA
jgi:hypothetical protein